MHAATSKTKALAYGLSGFESVIPKPTSLLDVKGVDVRKATGESVSVEFHISSTAVTIRSNVDLQNHTAFIF